MKITDIRAYVEIIARQRERDQRAKVGAGDSFFKETTLEQNVGLKLDGFVYHPNLLDFTLGGVFGLIQENFEDEFGDRKRSSGDEGTVLEFDFVGRLLQRKRYPGTISARRSRDLDPRPFQSSLETIATNYGLVWQYISDKTPTNLHLRHSDVLLEALSGDEEAGRQTNTALNFETSYRFNDRNVLSFSYKREAVSEEPFELNYDSDEVTLGHRWNFGDGHTHRLDSEVTYLSQRGTYAIERAQWQEILRLQHTEMRRSWYRLELLDRTQGSLAGVPPIQETSYFLSGTLEQKVYESLVMQVMAQGQSQEFGSGPQIDRIAFQATADYRKTNPWGVLLANYGLRYQNEDRRGGDQRIPVIDEPHTFRDPEPIIIVAQNIEPLSVTITADDKTTLYLPIRDYFVRAFVDRIEIHRVATGTILDQAPVLIDYVHRLGGTFELTTLSHNFGIRQNFEIGLTPFYRLRWQDQELTPAGATGVTPADITGQTVGLEFKRGRWRISGELEEYDSTVSPFTAMRLSADYSRRFNTGASGVVKARYTEVTYPPPDEREVTYFSVEGRYRHPLSRSLTVEGALMYRADEDTQSTNDQGIDADFSLEWAIRQSTVRLTYEYGRLENEYNLSSHSVVWIWIRRSFR